MNSGPSTKPASAHGFMLLRADAHQVGEHAVGARPAPTIPNRGQQQVRAVGAVDPVEHDQQHRDDHDHQVRKRVGDGDLDRSASVRRGGPHQLPRARRSR